MLNNSYTLVSEEAFIPMDNGLHWNESFLVHKKTRIVLGLTNLKNNASQFKIYYSKREKGNRLHESSVSLVKSFTIEGSVHFFLGTSFFFT